MATATERLTVGPTSFAKRVTNLLTRAPINIFLIAVGVFWLTPLGGILVSSFRSVDAYRDQSWWTAITSPDQFITSNYSELLANDRIGGAFLNTVKIAVPSAVIVVIIAALAAYAFAWIDFKGRDWLFLVVVGLLVMPLQMALIPAARLFGQIGIFNTVWAAIIFHIGFGLPLAIFLLRNFFIGIPADLLEAARMDGASEMQIFRRLMIPLGMPAIASLLIFQFVWTWNDLLVATVFAGGEAAPLTVFLRSQMRTYGTSIDIIAPGSFMLMIIPLIVFFSFQRFYIQGLLAGSVK
jgi:alpha-glucoside transport system permease protein